MDPRQAPAGPHRLSVIFQHVNICPLFMVRYGLVLQSCSPFTISFHGARLKALRTSKVISRQKCFLR